MKKYVIDFDMDHVLADFDKSFNEQYNDKQQFPQADAMFFHDLKPLSSIGGGDYFVDNYIYVHSLIAEGHKVRIVTAPSIRNVNCWTGKAYWVKKYFDLQMLEDLIITYDKSITSLTGDILVDDSTKNGQKAYGDRHLVYGSDKYPTMKHVHDQILRWSKEEKEFSLKDKIEDYKQYKK